MNEQLELDCTLPEFITGYGLNPKFYVRRLFKKMSAGSLIKTLIKSCNGIEIDKFDGFGLRVLHEFSKTGLIKLDIRKDRVHIKPGVKNARPY